MLAESPSHQPGHCYAGLNKHFDKIIKNDFTPLISSILCLFLVSLLDDFTKRNLRAPQIKAVKFIMSCISTLIICRDTPRYQQLVSPARLNIDTVGSVLLPYLFLSGFITQGEFCKLFWSSTSPVSLSDCCSLGFNGISYS